MSLFEIPLLFSTMDVCVVFPTMKRDSVCVKPDALQCIIINCFLNCSTHTFHYWQLWVWSILNWECLSSGYVAKNTWYMTLIMTLRKDAAEIRRWTESAIARASMQCWKIVSSKKRETVICPPTCSGSVQVKQQHKSVPLNIWQEI